MYASERGQSTVRNSVVDRVSEQRTPPRELGQRGARNGTLRQKSTSFSSSRFSLTHECARALSLSLAVRLDISLCYLFWASLSLQLPNAGRERYLSALCTFWSRNDAVGTE